MYTTGSRLARNCRSKDSEASRRRRLLHQELCGRRRNSALRRGNAFVGRRAPARRSAHKGASFRLWSFCFCCFCSKVDYVLLCDFLHLRRTRRHTHAGSSSLRASLPSTLATDITLATRSTIARGRQICTLSLNGRRIAGMTLSCSTQRGFVFQCAYVFAMFSPRAVVRHHPYPLCLYDLLCCTGYCSRRAVIVRLRRSPARYCCGVSVVDDFLSTFGGAELSCSSLESVPCHFACVMRCYFYFWCYWTCVG